MGSNRRARTCKYPYEEWWVPSDQTHVIVSNYPTGHDSRADLQEYQGHLVCERVIDPQIKNMILALPELLKAVEQILLPYSSDVTDMLPVNILELKQAYYAATGDMTYAPEPTAVPHPSTTSLKEYATNGK